MCRVLLTRDSHLNVRVHYFYWLIKSLAMRLNLQLPFLPQRLGQYPRTQSSNPWITWLVFQEWSAPILNILTSTDHQGSQSHSYYLGKSKDLEVTYQEWETKAIQNITQERHTIFAAILQRFWNALFFHTSTSLKMEYSLSLLLPLS